MDLLESNGGLSTDRCYFATARLQHLQMATSPTLGVLKGNSAERLYRRLGFEVTHETGLHRHMTWQAGPQ